MMCHYDDCDNYDDYDTDDLLDRVDDYRTREREGAL